MLLLAFAGAAAAQAPAPPDIAKAEALVRAGKAEEAWQLLAPHERRHAGRPEFDYALAVAALESGRAGRASFILERIVVQQPGHVAARLELARSYMALHDHERAEREFDFVLGASPSAEVRALIAGYRKGYAAAPGSDWEFEGHAELVVGRDTNVSAAMAQHSVFLPGLGAEFIPDARFARQGDRFTAVAAGLEAANRLSARTTFSGGAELRQRMHDTADALDSRAAELRAGIESRLDGRDRLRFSLRHYEDELDRARYRRTQGLAMEWSRLQSERVRLSVGAQGQRIRYLQPDIAASSSDLAALTARGAWLADPASGLLLHASAFAGRDNATAGRSDGDRRLAGLSLGVQRRLAAAVEGHASVALLQSDYADMNADFLARRRDRQTDFVLGAAWRLGGGWSLHPHLLHTRNRSNIALDDYKRTEAALALRYTWGGVP